MWIWPCKPILNFWNLSARKTRETRTVWLGNNARSNFEIGRSNSPPKLGGDASEASGEVPFGTTPALLLRLRPAGLALRGATPPNLGGDFSHTRASAH